MDSDHSERYLRYLEACNEHRFDRLIEFVGTTITVNGERRTAAEYIADVTAVGSAFPDYHWELLHLLVDGDLLAAHFRDTGTHRGEFLGVAATGRSVTMQEFALYRFESNLIVEVWSIADNLQLLHQLR